MIDNFKNKDIQFSTSPVRGQRIPSEDLKIFNDSMSRVLAQFGDDSKDVIEFSVYDLVDNLIEWKIIKDPSIFRIDTGKNQLIISPNKQLRDLGFDRGKYRVVYNFFKNLVGSYLGGKVYIQQISPSRKEVRIVPVKPQKIRPVASSIDEGTISVFGELDQEFVRFYQTPLNERLIGAILNFGRNETFQILNWELDDFTITDPPYSIILKLYEPLPDTISERQQCWISHEITPSFIDKVFLLGPEFEDEPFGNHLRPANFNIDVVNYGGGTDTPFETWDEILSKYSPTANQLVDKYLSSSLDGHIDINIDYTNYENFVRFGSAKERVDNFRYRLQLIESQSAKIHTLARISGSASQSAHVTLEVQERENKIRNVISNFDRYEQYLYYNSGSVYTSSLFSNIPGSFPKRTSTQPYYLYSVTSSVSELWYATQSDIASKYDRQNRASLRNTAPLYLSFDDDNETYLKFLDMVGHYFDILYSYICSLTSITEREESLFSGLAKDLTWHVAKSQGFDFSNGNNFVDLWKYGLGTDESGSYSSTGSIHSIPYENVTKEIWRRILNNLPYLLKTKGTSRAIRALISCYGIPASLLTIREYGGPDVSNDIDRSSYIFEDFVYALDMQSSQSVQTPWIDHVYTSRKPDSLELRFRTKGTANQLLMNTDTWAISLQQSGSTSTPDGYVTLNLSGSEGLKVVSSSALPVYDGGFWNVMFRRTSGSDGSTINQKYELYTKKYDFRRIVFQDSASIVISGSNALSASYNTAYETDSTIYIGGITGSIFTGQPLSGSVQEFRLWSEVLNTERFDNHVRFLKAIDGNSVSSSYDNLIRRFSFDNTTNHNSDTQVPDISPNQNFVVNGTASLFVDQQSYTPVNEEFSALVPNIGGNRLISNKIRIEDNYLAYGNLSHNKRAERSSYDFAPLDSNRVGIYFSPIDAVNKDIIASFGGTDLSGYIGDPRDQYSSSYSELKSLNELYWKKYPSNLRNINDYFRIVKYYDKTLFDHIKQLVPARTNLLMGNLIEPHLLERSKVQWKKPQISEPFYNSELLASPSGGLDGSVPYYQGLLYRSGTISSDQSPKQIMSQYTAPLVIGGNVPTFNATTTIYTGSANYTGSNLERFSIATSILDVTDWERTGSYSFSFTAGYHSYHYRYFRDPSTAEKRLKYDGCVQTSRTTPDGGLPIVSIKADPNRMIATDSGPSKIDIE